MDIEEISKSQIILLTLLISFVTSIATGIVTVSLMGQAPPSIAQTVNRIVERTVETVVPSGQSAATVVTTEKTIIVKESELIPDAVARALPSVARIYASDSEGPFLLGLGVVLDASGLTATDGDALGESGDAIVELQDGSRTRAFISARDKDSNIVFLQPATSTIDGHAPSWTPAAISVDHSRLGQTVIALAGKNRARIADGLVTALIPQKGTGSLALPDVIETNISSDAIMPGGVLINTDGEIIGMSTGASRNKTASGFIAASALVRQSVSPDKASDKASSAPAK